MKSNAEIKQHKGLDVVRYSEIAGTKGLAGERDVGHTRQIVKPASQPAPRPSYNPPWMVRVVCRQEDCRGEVQQWLAAQCWSGLCDFNKKTSVEKEPAASEMTVSLSQVYKDVCTVAAFPGPCTLTCGSGDKSL